VHYVGIDLHKNASQVCIYDEDREKYVERRVRTDLDGFQRALEKYAGARVLSPLAVFAAGLGQLPARRTEAKEREGAVRF
jgi:hypothetical protein